MPFARARYKQGEEYLEVVGLGKIIPTDIGLVATRKVLEPVALTSLQAALRRYEYCWGSPDEIHITDEEEAQIDDESQVAQSSLTFRDGLLMAHTFAVALDAKPDEDVVRDLTAPLLEEESMKIADLFLSEQKWGWGVSLTLEIPIRRRTVGDALRRADLICGAIEGAYPDEFDVTSAAYVIRARQPELLIGTFESEWLDVKSAPYRLDRKSDQYELAKDVASFANANGGLILLGAKTKRRPGGDEIKGVNGCVLSQAVPADLLSIIKKRLYPRVEDVRIEQISLSSSDRGVVLIEIPRQAAGQKPFLVAGTKSGDRVSELGFTYAVREGEGTEAPRIEVVHQLIRAGKAALAGNGVPSEVASLRADVERLEAANLEGWVSDVVLVAVKNGFHVHKDGDWLTFRKGDDEPLVIQATTPGPPADLLQREKLLEWLAERGLPVRRTAKGFLQPIHD